MREIREKVVFLKSLLLFIHFLFSYSSKIRDAIATKIEEFIQSKEDKITSDDLELLESQIREQIKKLDEERKIAQSLTARKSIEETSRADQNDGKVRRPLK